MEKTQNLDNSRPTDWQLILTHPLLLVLSTIIGAVIVAIPTYIDIIRKGGGYSQLTETINAGVEQTALWEKNSKCYNQTTPKFLTTPTMDLVMMLNCPSPDGKEEDVLLGLIRQNQTKNWWFTFNSPTKAEIPLILNLQKAFAEERLLHFNTLAQSSLAVLCQKQTPDGFIIRVIKFPNGQCVEEVINPRTGVSISSKPVDCYTC